MSRRAGLFVKYAASLVGLVTLVLLVNAVLDVFISFRDTREALVRVQEEKAAAAAQRIEQFVTEIEQHIGWTTHAQWAAGSPEQRRFDYIRLTRQAQAITEVVHIDGEGKEQLKVSRLGMDMVGSGEDWSRDPRFIEARARRTEREAAKRVWFSPVYFRKGSEPYLSLAVAGTGRDAGVTVAEINLKLIWDPITAIKVGKQGYAYVVDREGRLIAHPDISQVLRNTDLSGLPQVQAARAREPASPIARASDGREVLVAYAPIERLGWFVFVELPLGEALQPLWKTLWQTGGLLLLGLVLALGVGLFLARRMSVPIRALAAGADRLGAGELGHRIDVRTGDEVEALAQQFNRMAERLEESYTGLERKVEERTHELSEALQQQTATTEVLQTINASPGDLRPVFDAMLERAMRLCGAAFGFLMTYDGERFRPVAYRGVPKALADYFLAGPDAPRLGDAHARILAGEDIVHNPDQMNDEAYRSGNPLRRAVVDLGGARSALVVALRKERQVLGSLTIYRKEVRPFSEKEIELVQNFAAQAVIAMENARLLGELQARQEELARSVEELQATAEVLRIVASSPEDLEPVFATMLANAVRLCEAQFGTLWTYDDGVFDCVAELGATPSFKRWLAEGPKRAGETTALGMVERERRVIHIEDITADESYRSGDPMRRAAADLLGVRTLVAIPMLRETRLVGALMVHRTEVKRFTDKQIELVETFADQAVIAIANVRLLRELRARTGELARSVEELNALREVGQQVSASLDLRTVLKTIVERAVALSEADGGLLWRYDKGDRTFHLRTAHGFGDDLVEELRALALLEDQTHMGDATRERRPVELADLAGMPPMPLRDTMVAAGFRSSLIVPLVGARRVFGALVIQRRSPGAFPPATVSLMQALASQSVLAIQNARLFREIEEKGRQLAIASQHKSQFLANMSHELRTPLNAVLGYAELLVDGLYGELPERARGVLERIQSNGKHLLGLINDVLDLSKIEAGQLVLAHEDYTLAGLVQSVTSATESLARAKGLALETDVPAGLPTGRGDERRLTQVLLNLVGNAIKFTEAGRVGIAARAAGGFFEIAVSDTGPGIADADQARIFEEFQQVDNSSTRKKGGTGLGLAISRRIVEMHGGALTVQSRPGEGSTFRIRIPVRSEEKKEAAE